MTLICLICLWIIVTCECKINVYIKVSSIKTGANVSVDGFDDKLITDKEIKLFNITDDNLKRGVEIELGRKPEDVFLNDPTPYGNTYQKYKWTKVNRNLRVKNAQVLDIISTDAVVNIIDHINNTTKKTKIKINEFVPVENIVTSAWSKDGLPDDDIDYNINVDFVLKKVQLKNNWRNTTLRTVETQFGLQNLGYVDVGPGKTVTTKLVAKKTIALYKITYIATLTGSIIANFAHEYGKYHFYSPLISNIMKANGMVNEIITTEVIEVKCFTDPRLEVFDKSSGERMGIKFVNKPFTTRKYRNKHKRIKSHKNRRKIKNKLS